MNEDLLYLIGIVILQIALVGYFYIKDRENSLKLLKIQEIIEDIHKSLHYVRKELENKADRDFVPDDEEKMKHLNSLIQRQVQDKIIPILRSLKGFENVIEEFQNEQENRLSHLEQRTQNISKLTPNYENEEQRIIELFKSGKSIEQIAKDLRIGTSLVELTLKLKKLVE